MSGTRFVAMVAACLVVSAFGASALAADERNRVRFGIGFVSPTGDLTVDGFYVEDVDPSTRLEFQGSLTLEPDEAIGYWVGYERLFTDRVGLDVTILSANHDVDGTLNGTLFLIENATGTVLDQEPLRATETVGDIDVRPLMVGVDFHLTPRKAVDVYVGPFIAYVMYGDLELIGEESIPIDDDFTFGVVAGIDVPFADGRWFFSSAARYIDTEADPKESGPDAAALDVNPWILQVGVGVRF